MADSLGDGNQARTHLGRFNGRKAVIKTVPNRSLPVIAGIYRWMIQREARALRRLKNVEGVPDLLGIPDKNSIAMEYRDGMILRQASRADLSEDFFVQLEALVHEIHAHGVVHSDLKRKENVMVGRKGEPIIIDLGTHFIDKQGFHPINSFFYDQFLQMDLNAVSKLKKQFFPDTLEAKDQERLNSPTFFERADRFRREYLWDW